MRGEDRLYSDLKAQNIVYQVYEHEAVFTVEQSDQINHDISGARTKNLFLKDAGGQFWLATVPAAARVDLKTLPLAINSKRISFGKAEDMLRLLGVMPGSVTPLAAINDTSGVVRVVIDSALRKSDRINVHPLRNTATLNICSDDLVRTLTYWDHAPIIADIPTLEDI
jgi:Ala-tRNA(Pro) deacylase